MSPRFLVLADDLTGALEAGALYARSGVTSSVLISDLLPHDKCTEAMVLDIETRHADPKRAESVVTRAISDARALGIFRIYLKIDSTLRGPIASQVSGLCKAWPERSVIFTPAYPRMGRTVRDGSLYVNGTLLADTAFAYDPLDPARTSRLADKLSSSACNPPVLIRSAAELRRGFPSPSASLFLCDAATDEDLAQLASVIVDNCVSCICVGSSGLLAELIRAEHPFRPRSGLIVNGSLHSVSLQQCAAARSNLPVFELGEEDVVARLGGAIRSSGWTVLSTKTDLKDHIQTAQHIAMVAAAVIKDTTCESLTIFGGDTARHVLAMLNVSTIYPIRELMPGIPVSRIVVGDRDLKLITKAGGFGNVDVIHQLRGALSGSE